VTGARRDDIAAAVNATAAGSRSAAGESALPRFDRPWHLRIHLRAHEPTWLLDIDGSGAR
jgi:hypothetical protein